MDGKGEEVRVARITAVVIGVVAILGGILANGQNIAFLVALAFAVAASANLPTILYSLFWKRFNTSGALWSIYGGLAITLAADRVLAGGVGQEGRERQAHRVDDPGRRLPPGSRWTTRASSRSRCRSCSATSARCSRKDKADPARYAEMEVRSLTGVGSAKAIVH